MLAGGTERVDDEKLSLVLVLETSFAVNLSAERVELLNVSSSEITSDAFCVHPQSFYPCILYPGWLQFETAFSCSKFSPR